MNFIQQYLVFYFSGTDLVDLIPRPNPQVRILKQELGPTTVASGYGGHIEVSLVNSTGGVDGIGIGGSYLQDDPGGRLHEAPVINSLGDFLSCDSFARELSPRVSAVEVNNEERHHDQDQSYRYSFKDSLHHLLLEYTGIP